MLFWINSGSSIQQNGNCKATNLPSRKPSKKEPQDTLGITSKIWTNFISDIHQWFPAHQHTSVGRTVKTNIHQLSVVTVYHQEDLLRVMYAKNGWQEKTIKGSRAVGVPWWKMTQGRSNSFYSEMIHENLFNRISTTCVICNAEIWFIWL